MFYPQAMTEVQLIVPEKDLVPVTRVISGQGVFQQSDGSLLNTGKDTGSSNTWQEKSSAYATLERRIQTILQILGLDEGQPPSKDMESMVDLDSIRGEIDGIEGEVRKVNDQINNDNKRIEQLEAVLRQVEPVTDIDVDLASGRNSHYLYSVLGTMPVANMARLQTSLSRIPFIFLPLRQDNQNAVVWLAGSQSNADVLERAVRSSYLNPLVLPGDYQGTPKEIISTVQQEIESTRKEIAELKKKLGELRGTYQKRLHELLWQVRASHLLADAIVHYGKLKYTFVIVGWVPTARLANFTARVKHISKEALIETFPTNRSGHNQDIPVNLNHPRWMRPFESLVIQFARPRYGELDPTWLIALTFPIIYGAMFGDLGQGLVLAALGALIVSKRVKALHGLYSLGGLIFFCGIFAAIFGVLYGSFFGYEDVIHPLWIAPINNIVPILIIAITAGVVLLTLGFILGIINAAISRDWGEFIFGHNGIAGLLFYWSLIGLGLAPFFGMLGAAKYHMNFNLGIPTPILLVTGIISLIMVTFSDLFQRLVDGIRPLVEESLGTYGIQLFFELFETLISYLSNTLSYVRVGAFAVAHAGLSLAIFNLTKLAGPQFGPGYWIVVVLGNIFIIGFEGLIVGIQTMRLSYYEFFSKFFQGGGKTYEPLTMYPAQEE